jgi:DNA-binding NarL/FixJ family response regulator
VIRIVLADDHMLIREGIRALVALVPDMSLVGEAKDGTEAVRVVVDTRPDVLLLDMRMPGGDGLWVVRELRRRELLPSTLILSTFDDDAAALDVVRAGARGFLLKDVTLDRLVDAVRTLAAGGTMIRPRMTARAEGELAIRGVQIPAAPDGELADLTEREREVLRLLASGFSNREIARALFVAEGTVKNHVSNILTKMGVRDRTRAVIKAAERGLLG